MIYFTADTHFGHKRVIEMGERSVFPTVEDHDDAIIDAINRMVDRHDTLHILGDFAFKTPQRYRSRIRCRHVLFTKGNHDRSMASLQTFGETPLRRIARLETVPERIVLDHFPEAFWHNCHRGWYHAYGHVHGFKEETLDKCFPERRSMDVGVDNAYRLLGQFRPFSEVEFIGFLSHRKGHDPIEVCDEE